VPVSALTVLAGMHLILASDLMQLFSTLKKVLFDAGTFAATVTVPAVAAVESRAALSAACAWRCGITTVWI